jgi:hypothetical protein
MKINYQKEIVQTNSIKQNTLEQEDIKQQIALSRKKILY